MSFVLGSRSLSFVSHVDQRMIAVAQEAIKRTEQDFGFTAEQSRTLAEEEHLMQQGFSHTLFSHHIVDCKSPGHWAAPGFSGAVDAVPWTGSAFSWDWDLVYEVAAAFRAAFIALNIPGTWGGAWNLLMSEIPGDGSAAAMKAAQIAHRGWDGVHFELFRNWP